MKNRDYILITGCGGMLGSSLYPLCIHQGNSVLATDIDINEPWLHYLDVTEPQACEERFKQVKPAITIHLAALTDLEYCEIHPEKAWKVNALGTENIASLCKKYNSLMVYISTAGLFVGTKNEYSDFDTPEPVSCYAKSKYHGEVFIERFLEKYFIFRSGWMMGGGPQKDKKFINKLYKKITAGDTEIFAVDDKFGSPTCTCNFSESLLKVIQTRHYGLYNQTCGGSANRYDVAVEFIRLLELENRIKVTPVQSGFFKNEYFAHRPHSEKLINMKLDMRCINFMKDWRACLREYAPVFKKDYELQKQEQQSGKHASREHDSAHPRYEPGH